MIILAVLASLAAIGALCWLLFTLAVFALPAFVGATVGAWAYGTGAGVPGAILIGLVAAAVAGAELVVLAEMAHHLPRELWPEVAGLIADHVHRAEAGAVRAPRGPRN